jgi:UDP-2,3-diacylglucosamine hydrolase
MTPVKARTERTFIFSDLHMDRWTEERRQIFRGFMSHVEEHATECLVMGDILDFPAPAGKSVWPDHREIILRLRALPKLGIKTTYVIGNHDIGLHGVEVHEKDFTVTYVSNKQPMLREFGSVKAHIEHGHDYDPLYREHVYDAVEFMDRLTGTELDQWVTDLWSDLAHVFDHSGKRGRSHGKEPGVPERLLKIWQRAAEQILKKQQHLNCVLFGHTHAPMIVPMLSEKQYYVNTGDWLVHMTYVEISGGHVSLKSWSPKKTIATFHIR